MAAASGRKKKSRNSSGSPSHYPAGQIIKALLAKRPVREIMAVCAVLLALYTLISLGNHPRYGWEMLPTGWLGYYLASVLLAGLGAAAWGVPLLLILWSVCLARGDGLWDQRLHGAVLLLLDLSLAAGAAFFGSDPELGTSSLQGLGGGLLGNYAALSLHSLADRAGLYICIMALLAIGLLLAAAIPLSEWPARGRLLVKSLARSQPEPALKAAAVNAGIIAASQDPASFTAAAHPLDDAIVIKPDPELTLPPGMEPWTVDELQEKAEKAVLNRAESANEPAAAGSRSAAVRAAGAPYRKPPLDLLRDMANDRVVDRQEIQNKVRVLEQTFANFGIDVKVGEVSCGPVVTRYELSPAPGVKVSRISSLADDLQLSMAARGLRLEVPIPGKAAVGIEIPNDQLASVSLKSILASSAFKSRKNPLAMALGEDIAGNMVVGELNEMPHLLVAGATGSGKSVCVNAMIISLLFNAHPDEVKMVLIDPKKVELTGYNGIPHLLAPVVTDPKKAARVLKWMTLEMEKRYQLFTDSGVRDIKRYNEKAEERLPFIVVVIDELADLMMVSPGDVEDAICRLAQMARAAGIHLIVSTQRPSVDVITGLIKANIPSRIAFAVSSQVDSRTILDGAGAEKLLGKGDMLYMPVGAIKPMRVQGAFVSDAETIALVEYLRTQTTPVENSEESTPMESEIEQCDEEAEDALFWDAVRLVVGEERLSASFLQRKLKVGYSRAARLVDMMEERGIVSAMGSDRKRRILISSEELEQILARKRF